MHLALSDTVSHSAYSCIHASLFSPRGFPPAARVDIHPLACPPACPHNAFMEPPVQEQERQRYSAPTASLHHPNSSPTSLSDSSLLSSSSGSDGSSSEQEAAEGEQQEHEQEQYSVQNRNGAGVHGRDGDAERPSTMSSDPTPGSSGPPAESGSSSGADSHARHTEPTHHIAAGPGPGESFSHPRQL